MIKQVIDTLNLICINSIIIEEDAIWNPPENCILQYSDTIWLGDNVEMTDQGGYVKI